MAQPLFTDFRAGLLSPNSAHRLPLIVFLGRTTDAFPITVITQQYQNAQVLIDQDVTLESFTVMPGVHFIEGPVIALSNASSLDITVTPNGCTIDDVATPVVVPAKGELVLIALATGQFHIQGSPTGGGVGVWGGISGSLTDQADLVAALDAKANRDNPTFTNQVTFLGGIRVPNGEPVSGPLTMAQHGGGYYATAGPVTIPTEQGFTVTLRIVHGSHTVGPEGGTQKTFLINEVIDVASFQSGVVFHRPPAVWTQFTSAAFQSFDAKVALLNPSGYWKLAGNGNEHSGGLTATVNFEATVPTIVEFDRIAEGAASDGICISFSGATGQWAELPNDALFQVPGGTFVIFHQHDILTGKRTLISRDNLEAEGGFSLEVENACHRLYVRPLDGGPPIIRTDTPGVIAANQAYCSIIKWGFEEALFVNDSFTGTNSTTLTAHTVPLGGPWVKQPGEAGLAEIQGNQVILSTVGTAAPYYATAVPASADYVVEAVVVANSNGGAGVLIRASTSANEFYRLQYETPANQWILHKRVGGTTTQLGTPFLQARTIGRRYSIRLEASGSILRAWIDGMLRITATDVAPITAAGRAGIRLGPSASSDTIDQFRASAILTLSGWSAALYGSGANLIERKTITSNTDRPNQTSPTRIGAFNVGGTSRHDGPIGRLIFFNRRLTPADERSVARPRSIVHS